MKSIVAGFGLLIFCLLVLFRLSRYGVMGAEKWDEYWIAGFSALFLALGIFLSRRYFRKEVVVEKPVLRAPGEPFVPDEKNLQKTQLSKRELEILHCIGEGLSNQQIAEKLFVSENTIKKHISSIYLKLDVERRTEAVKRARELHILP